VLDAGRNPQTGKRRQKWIGPFDSKKAARADMRGRLTKRDDGQDPFPRDVSVASWSEQWFAHLETSGRLRQRTLYGYRALFRDHVVPVIGDLPMRVIAPAHIQRVLDEMTAAEKAPRTVSHCRAALSGCWKHAVRMRVVPVNVVRDSEAPKKERPELQTPDASELRALLDAAEGTEWEAAVLLSTRTGARRGEILAALWRDVDFDESQLRIVASLQRDDANGELVRLAPKTKRSTRMVPLDRDTVARLRRLRVEQATRLLALGIRATDETPVCDDMTGAPINPERYSKAWGAIATRAGCSGVRLHDCRHGVASLLAARNVRTELIARTLGHADESFTMRTYIHPEADELKAVADVIGDALGG
jgi:integrase